MLDERGHPTAIALRCKTAATSMIEEAMILANETVAGHLSGQETPCVYRVHEPPRAQALEALLPPLSELGFSTSGLAAGDPKAFQALLVAAQGHPSQSLIDHLVLRSMERARYSVQPAPHFGLASERYCHFTSPIRRYPDLMVHRLLRDAHAMEGSLEWLAAHSSKMEQLAEQAERDSVNLKLCEYMADRIGEVFVGSISTVTASGFFVRLDTTVEGMVAFDRYRDEFFEFDPKLQTLVGEETGRTFRLGQQVRVRLVDVSLAEQHVDFELA